MTTPSEDRAKVAESMLALRDKGYAWPYVAKRHNMTERDARRLCADYMRGKMGGDGLG